MYLYRYHIYLDNTPNLSISKNMRTKSTILGSHQEKLSFKLEISQQILLKRAWEEQQ